MGQILQYLPKIKRLMRIRALGTFMPLLLMVLVLTGCPIPASMMNEGAARGGFTSSTGGACVSARRVISFTPDEGEALQRWYACNITGQLGARKGVVTYITDYVQCKLKTGISYMMNAVINASWYKLVLKLSFAIAIILYGIVIALGMQKLNPFEILGLIAKAIIIFFLVSSFNVYNEYIINFFENGVRDLGGVMAGTLGMGITGIEFTDNTISTILSFRFMKLFLALLAMGRFGWLYAVLLAFVVYFYAMAIIRVVYIFVMSMLMRYLLYTTGPLFLCFMLFKQTRKMFTNWTQTLIAYSLQPIFLMALLGFFHRVITVFFGELVAQGYAICYSSFFTMGVLGMNFFTLNWWFFEMPNGATAAGNSGNSPVSLWGMMSICMLAFMLRSMVDWVQTLATTISQVQVSNFIPMYGSESISTRLEGLAMRPIGMAGGALFGSKDGSGQRQGGLFSISTLTSPRSVISNMGKGASGGWNNAAKESDNKARRADRQLFHIEDKKSDA
ncbi:MAG: type IV secretion system protein [Proteobacteria bacterium]|nr:type IV secretion system protein [Pseudomonadota bacterium]